MNPGKGRPTYNPPKIWEGETVFILGGGPSLLMSPLELIHNRKVLAVNDAFTLGNWVDAAYFGDCKWWDWNKEEFKKFPGLKMTACQRLYHIDGVRVWKRGKPKGVEERPGHISWNSNSGFSSINVAYHLGAKRIVLVGFDMGGLPEEVIKEDNKLNYNWHNRHKTAPLPKSYRTRFLPNLPNIVEDLKRLNVEIVNASFYTAMNDQLVKRVKLEDCYDW